MKQNTDFMKRIGIWCAICAIAMDCYFGPLAYITSRPSAYYFPDPQELRFGSTDPPTMWCIGRLSFSLLFVGSFIAHTALLWWWLRRRKGVRS